MRSLPASKKLRKELEENKDLKGKSSFCRLHIVCRPYGAKGNNPISRPIEIAENGVINYLEKVAWECWLENYLTLKGDVGCKRVNFDGGRGG